MPSHTDAVPVGASVEAARCSSRTPAWTRVDWSNATLLALAVVRALALVAQTAEVAGGLACGEASWPTGR